MQPEFQAPSRRQDIESTRHSGATVLDKEPSPIDASSLDSMSPICPAPLCRQFWRAGNYDSGLISKSSSKNGASFLRIHPKFLHSNATSHKWAFGAIAELLDNAIDEIQNGATYAIVDKTLNPKDGTSALLIQDNGGGMDQEAMHCCLSFGFSDKKSESAIGQYGNGFKTSSMRLGADVVVFSRCMKNRKLTQSVGLLSFTFLTRAGLDRIVVPMIEYEFRSTTRKWTSICSEQHFVNNLSLLLQWSPFSTEEELLKQFDDIGDHGTKIVIYNLWLNDEGQMELDFQSDPEDIRISCDAESDKSGSRMSVSDLHLANTLRCSLRAYLSILYLRIPENFCIWLRGQIVEYHNIANDLKYPEFILYKPQNGGCEEGSVITSIGFLKEAPLVNIHGFNVYHKNRLILPFWHVVVGSSVNRSRGVVGVLEANFIKPTHNKQDFEKTPLFQKLENRLKEMTLEYWDYHCGLIGYHTTKRHRAPSQDSLESRKKHASTKRKDYDRQIEPEILKQKAGLRVNLPDPESIQNPPATTTSSDLEDQEMVLLLRENKRLHARCLEKEKKEEEYNAKVTSLRKQLKEAQREYRRLLVQSGLLENPKRENTIIIL
ncbi:protein MICRORCHIDIA 6-like isoform X1 [Lycium ferocissimum]|uniref:protein MICRORCHIDIA 6-like isoform X1 n=1 Tax=Lycium ferocissimum TaxID=112874 RepID=UPI0028169394|nr:protein MICRORCHIDIA 6-like isoform X1 [Lycium ferocissimum]XP_059300637.1 protein MICRORCHIDIA 6-like isoform X1 [Lycium ferocissimum]XP_059300638.1 protein MICRORCHIDIA 6-like isoform X1 [Lycium ferocissimum]XP_059300639.1 protein MICRORCHIDIA 6-like isoform X1 [Lycium ferocissimum]XP_059300640.1 protein MICRORCHIDIA 6-like isoform X1 [Lycium ferocissimum]XP_059300641.1 protein MICRORCHIDIA 6-like isoform X1 [Lycium ferocissimum]XP_059300642.1 protein MICRORCHIDIA 6-like isoform X1 [Lyci